MFLLRLVLSFKALNNIWRRTQSSVLCIYFRTYCFSLPSLVRSLMPIYYPLHLVVNSLYIVPYLRVRDQVSPTYITVYSLLVYSRLWVIVLQLLLK